MGLTDTPRPLSKFHLHKPAAGIDVETFHRRIYFAKLSKQATFLTHNHSQEVLVKRP